MRSAAAAFAWEFHRRHRIGLIGLGGYLLTFIAIKIFVLPSDYVLRVDPPNGLAAFIIVPVTAMMFYLVGVFTFGLSGDLSAKASIYPAHKLTLPVTTRALAGWPMLYGTTTLFALAILTMALLRWVNTRAFAVPLVWPGLLVATYLAWTQAFMWMPYGLHGLRVIIAVIFLTAVDAIVFIAIEKEARELTMIGLLSPQLPLAYWLACIAVGRARRGEVPDWGLRRLIRFGSGTERAMAGLLHGGTFASAWRAQVWFEWRQHGWTLPAMVGMVVPAELLLWFIPGSSPTVFMTLFAVIVTPPFLAAFAAAKLTTSTAFSTMRPLTTGSLVGAKLVMSILSTLTSWLVVAVAAVAAAWLSGKSALLIDRANTIMEVTGTLRFFAVMALIGGAAVASTWKHLVQSLCIGLTGRASVIRSSVVVALLACMAIGPLIDWIADRPAVQSAIWHSAPWILAAIVTAKALASGCVAAAVIARGVLSDRTVILGALSWLACVAALYGTLAWLIASPLVPRYELTTWAILLTPSTRIGAAPLALAWSRHR